MPRIGDLAPDFEAETTKGTIRFSDYAKGRWVILFSHPSDFTPVCTSEMCGFATRKHEFDALDTDLMGLSIDSIYSHLTWMNYVKQRTGVSLNFPIIADIDMNVSGLYGMVQPNESEAGTVRAVFFIDPAKRIRMIMYYPLSVGRNMDEIIRVLNALQSSDKHKGATPLDWRVGDEVLIHSSDDVDGMRSRLDDGGMQ